VKCRHPKRRRWTYRKVIVRFDNRSDLLVYDFCNRCGAWLSLGPANDAGCFVEIEAARIASTVASGDGFVTIDWDSAVGGAAYDIDGDPPKRGYDGLWRIGWLSRHITQHPEGES
jgi:hypothetical protein